MNERYPSLQLATSFLEGAARWLLFLSPSSFEEEAGGRLEAALLVALSSGAQPVVLWSPDAPGEFGDIIAATPPALKGLGLYGPLAIEWRGGIHGAVSVRLVAKALGARATGDGMCECAKRCAAAAKDFVLGRARVFNEGEGRDTMLLRSVGGRRIERRLSARQVTIEVEQVHGQL